MKMLLTLWTLLLVIVATNALGQFSLNGRKIIFDLRSKQTGVDLAAMGLDPRTYQFVSPAAKDAFSAQVGQEAMFVAGAIQQANDIVDKNQKKKTNGILKHIMKAYASFGHIVNSTPVLRFKQG